MYNTHYHFRYIYMYNKHTICIYIQNDSNNNVIPTNKKQFIKQFLVNGSKFF